MDETKNDLRRKERSRKKREKTGGQRERERGLVWFGFFV